MIIMDNVEGGLGCLASGSEVCTGRREGSGVEWAAWERIGLEGLEGV
jgi:hypothetical protein